MSYTGILGLIPNPPMPAGGGTDAVIYSNGQTINSGYTIPANTNSASYGPITIGASATVVIPASSTWVVI